MRKITSEALGSSAVDFSRQGGPGRPALCVGASPFGGLSGRQDVV